MDARSILSLLYTNHSSLNCYFWQTQNRPVRLTRILITALVILLPGWGEQAPPGPINVKIPSIIPPEETHLITVMNNETKKLRTDMTTSQMTYLTCRMTTHWQTGLIQKVDSIACPATFQNLKASRRGCVLISSSKFTLPDGLPQCLVLETFCTVPALAGLTARASSSESESPEAEGGGHPLRCQRRMGRRAAPSPLPLMVASARGHGGRCTSLGGSSLPKP